MGASAKTLARIMSLVDGNFLSISSRIAELGTQNLHCEPQSAIDFLRFFSQRGAKISMAEVDAASVASGGQLGYLLRGVGFDYTAFDIFEAADTKVMDLNIQIVPAELRGQFDLVTNYGTTEHVLNQMLAMRSIHDLAKPQGLIHHDLPMGGYYLHCYFTYNPSLFHDLATANGYRLVFQEISSGNWRKTPSALSDAGFADEKFRDYGIELVLQKTSNDLFRIPVDNTTSDAVSLAAWTSNDIAVTVSPVLPVDPRSIKTLFARLPFRTVHAAYWARVKDLIRNRVLPAP